MGTIERPQRAAKNTMPGFDCRRGPRGPSGVITTWVLAGSCNKFANGRGAVAAAGAAHQADAQDFQAAGEVRAVVMPADQRDGAHMPAGEHGKRDGVVPDGVDESFGAVAGIRIRVRRANQIADAKRAEQASEQTKTTLAARIQLSHRPRIFMERAAFRVPHGTRYVAKAAY